MGRKAKPALSGLKVGPCFTLRWLRRCRRKCWAGSLAVQVYGVAETRGAAAATNSPSLGVHGD